MKIVAGNARKSKYEYYTEPKKLEIKESTVNIRIMSTSQSIMTI